MIKKCKKKKIGFLTSIFDYTWTQEIKKHNLNFIKIPSGEIDYFPLLKSVANLKKKVLLSTGASTFNEVKNAVKFLFINGLNKKNLTIMHCNSAYPTPTNDVNLLAIKYIKEKFKIAVGFSDHSLGNEAAIASIPLGVVV